MSSPSELTTSLWHPSAFAGTSGGEESDFAALGACPQWWWVALFHLPACFLRVLYLSTFFFFSLTNLWAGSAAISTTLPFLVVSLVSIHCGVHPLCPCQRTVDVSLLVLMTAQCPQQPKLQLCCIRAGVWGLGSRWFVLGRSEEVTARVENKVLLSLFCTLYSQQ